MASQYGGAAPSSSPISLGTLKSNGLGGNGGSGFRRFNLPISSGGGGASRHSKFVPPSFDNDQAAAAASSSHHYSPTTASPSSAPPVAPPSYATPPPHYGNTGGNYNGNAPMMPPYPHNQLPSPPMPPFASMPPPSHPNHYGRPPPPPAFNQYQQVNPNDSDSEDEREESSSSTTMTLTQAPSPFYPPPHFPPFPRPNGAGRLPYPSPLPPPPPLQFFNQRPNFPGFQPPNNPNNAMLPPSHQNRPTSPQPPQPQQQQPQFQTMIGGRRVKEIDQLEPGTALIAPYNIAVIAQARAGKTNMLLTILATQTQSFDVVFCFTLATDTRDRLREEAPGVIIFYGLEEWNDGKNLANILDAMDALTNVSSEDRISVGLILDDLLSDEGIGRHKIWTRLFTRMHHSGLTTFALMHGVKMLPPGARNNYQFVIAGLAKPEVVNDVYGMFFQQFFPDKRDFDKLYSQYVRKGAGLAANLKDPKMFLFETEDPSVRPIKPFNMSSRQTWVAMQMFGKFKSSAQLPGGMSNMDLAFNASYQKFMGDMVDSATGAPIATPNQGPTIQYHVGAKGETFGVKSNHRAAS